jgi:hypothetical protein
VFEEFGEGDFELYFYCQISNGLCSGSCASALLTGIAKEN